MSDDTFSSALFMCHAPIVIPSLGGNRAEQCKATTEAMFKAADALVATKPDRVIVFNPHLTRYKNAYACVNMPSKIQGTFKPFGRADLKIEFPSEQAFYAHLVKNAEDNQFEMGIRDANELDHGAMVPLWFLEAAGFKGSVCIIGFPWQNPQKAHTEFGRFLKQICSKYGGRTAIIASGDMSHRLQYGAPAGYNPRAHEFDDTFIAHVKAGELEKASHIPVALRDLAAEDSSESMAIAAGAIGETISNTKVLSYESPFGVGYMVAILA